MTTLPHPTPADLRYHLSMVLAEYERSGRRITGPIDSAIAEAFRRAAQEHNKEKA